MTNQEAIEKLKSKMDGHTDTSYEWAETVRMAIKALEQEPCDKYINEIDHLRKYISKLETQIVEQEPKTGHWIAVVDKWGDIITTVSGYKCSECGEFDSFRDKFCPNCGARMVEPQESEGSE